MYSNYCKPYSGECYCSSRGYVGYQGNRFGCPKKGIRWLYQYYPENRPYFVVCEAILGPYIIDHEGYFEYTKGEN